jgi:hypothetical protein
MPQKVKDFLTAVGTIALVIGGTGGGMMLLAEAAHQDYLNAPRYRVKLSTGEVLVCRKYCSRRGCDLHSCDDGRTIIQATNFEVVERIDR